MTNRLPENGSSSRVPRKGSKAIAEAYAAEDAPPFLVDRDETLLEETAAALASKGTVLGFQAADISDVSAIEAAGGKAEEQIGSINALVNNAGVNVFAEPLQTTDEEWRALLRHQSQGRLALLPFGSAVPDFGRRRGDPQHRLDARLHHHSLTLFPYPLAKHALLGMTKSLGIEYAPQNVRVNAIVPATSRLQKVIDYWNSFPDPEKASADTMKLHPGGRIATPQEIAMAAVFMISDECSFMNATCLTIDGGLRCHAAPIIAGLFLLSLASERGRS